MFDTIFERYAGSKKNWLKVATGVLAVGTTIYIVRKLTTPKPTNQIQNSVNAVKINLMAHETTTMMMLPPITTATKFKVTGIYPEAFIREKISAILRANPWLAGRLVLNEADGLHLIYEPIAEKIYIDELMRMVNDHFVVIENFEMSHGANQYEELERSISKLQVKTGNECINKANAPLFRASLLKIKGSDEAMLVFSLSHVLADGFTFYQLHGMLDRHTPVTAMEVVRFANYDLEVQRLMKPSYGMGATMLLGMFGCSTFGSKMHMHMVQVDNAWIAQQKEEYQSRKGVLPAGVAVEYVSTNDILTSWHSRLCKSDIALMSINCRSRTAAFTDTMAGNYENSIAFYTPDDCDSPEAIRRSLRTYRGATMAAPSAMQVLQWNSSLASNWSSFYKQIDLSDPNVGCRCDHVIHLPMMNSRDMSYFREGVCIFSINALHTGMLVFTRFLTPQAIESTGVGFVCNTF